MSGSDKLLPVVAASYNMSFAADLNNHNLGSEKHRSFTNKEQLGSARAGWFNALEKVKLFVTNNDNFVIGMQEMNNYFKIQKSNSYLKEPTEQMEEYTTEPEAPAKHTGVHHVVSELQKIKKNIQYHFSGVNGFGGTFPSLLTVWDSALGSLVKFDTVDLCVMHNDEQSMGNNEEYKKEMNQELSGRPFTIITTDKGYTFINLHGINKNGHSVHYTNWLRKFIRDITVFRYMINMDKLIIMGDFNDPQNYIKDLKLLDKKFSYGLDNVIKSCCYNYNSSCNDELMKSGVVIAETNKVVDNGVPHIVKHDTKDDLEQKLWVKYFSKYAGANDGVLKKGWEYLQYFQIHIYYRQCPILVFNQQLFHDNNIDKLEDVVANGKTITKIRSDLDVIFKSFDESVGYSSARTMDEQGNIANYKFTGDYIFMSDALLNGRKLAIYNGPMETVGKASDHEMVYIGTPETSRGGGNRTRRNKNQRNRTRRINKKY